MKKVLILITTAIMLLLSGCGVYPPVDSLAPSPTHISVATLPPVPSPTLMPADTPIPPTPTSTPAPTETPLPEATPTFTPEPDWLNYAGRTEDELMFLGNPEAPVTLIDFSDFM